ncbi:M3 family metallopeptidase [Montanilutibacter psychrotolerans]|uniref:Dipeptidyl carboxypeptidase n=1 Tax=Montanilutibacter psychrotolerans TaxID=1327343 RepID=A0A3M8SVB2_9GAMM|nr:M3 family metallopeptidase [Lysobacter psychrotolerans]RNF85281.1 M3 family peptidase [Lysobacter psychrotolerans]
MKHPLALAVALALSAAALPAFAQSSATTDTAVTAQAANPFFNESPLPLHYPQFDKIKDSDFGPAFDQGMAEQSREMEAIANQAAPATFENTIVAMEKTGATLSRTILVFFNLVGADSNEAREKIEADYAPKLSAHRDAIYLNPKLFGRIKALYDTRSTLGLDAESVRLIERYHTDFVRSGANLPDASKVRLKAINSELATLDAEFSKNVRAEVNDSAIVVDNVADLAGLSEEAVAAAAEAAKARKLEGKYVIALMNTTGQPPETYLQNRALRERLHKASVARGSRGNEFDTTPIVAKVLKLRAEMATMLGYPDYASYVLEDETAKNPQAVNAMLGQLAPAAVANARREGADLQAMIDKEQAAKGEPTFQLQPWDWAFYSEKVRQEKFNFDENQLKPYLELKNVLENGVFYAANQLYGLSFKQRTDLPVYHPDVIVYDVFDRDGKQLAIFLADMYARESKRGGAWMNSYVDQNRLLGTLPVVANHLNIPKPSEGKPTLLTWDEVTTTFHEFGHALHGMFSDVKYPYFSGTNVPRDFVEYPSQVNEMWADWPSVLANYAKHYQTGAAMPKELLDKVVAAGKFNQGFATTEYLASAMLDQNWHQASGAQIPAADGVMNFEAAALKKDGLDYAPVPPRYKTPYFSHIMGGYAAGYYAYIWSEVLDANTVQWIKQNGGLTRANGDHFRATLLSQGGSQDALKLFNDFAGHAPQIQPLLERRGLIAAPASDGAQPAAATNAK